jgi:polyphosphate kinase 2
VDSTCGDSIEIDANADEVAPAIMAAQATVALVRGRSKDWSLDRSEVRAMSKANKKSAHGKDHHHQAGPSKKMKRKEYEREMRILQGELVAMQEWVKATGARVCIVFEGVDSAGKGGTIRRITERTSPRVFKHIALPAPDARVKSQMYIQRYVAHFPSAGEVVIFDRSWYNRAGVEPVMGYCTQEETKRFLAMVPLVEKAMVDDGIILIKYFLNVSRDEQTRRLESRIDDPRKVWKLSPTDLKSYRRRYAYLQARDTMLVETGSGWAPWHIVDNDDKKRGRLNIITHLLSQIPYKPPEQMDVKMPKPPSHSGYVEPESSRPNIPTPF